MNIQVQTKQVSRLIGLKDVIARTSMSKTTIYELIKEGRFPSQVKLGCRSVAWVESEIDSFIEGVISNRQSAWGSAA
jgi:Predicted transcriptional regulator